ncbi:MAG: class I SAM-dependent rRNA methyltransferase [Elusimicrobia bacterium]|nr:class I SAM-dependent rRNA methyltransferase [Elusimicrobiota bacterium]
MSEIPAEPAAPGDGDGQAPPEKKRGVPAAHKAPIPWVRLRSAGSGPQLFKRMLGEVDPKARPGDLVAVYDKSDAPYGLALYNPRSLIALRLIHRGAVDFDLDQFFGERIRLAVEFRRDALELDKRTSAYRLVHDLGDGLPGLVIDRLGDYFVLEFYSIGMFKQAERLEKLLLEHFPAAKFVRRASQFTESMEGFKIKPGPTIRTRIRENGVSFEVEPSGGYKTGFFCDQRENRLEVSRLASGRRVLDAYSYTGGFGLYASVLGGAKEVTCVELDPDVCELVKKNANINQVRINTVCCDAFPYLRQMEANKEKFGLVILDPYKLIGSRETYALGRKKYADLNRLGFSIVEPGGIMVTCSCSGMLPWEEFQQIIRTAAGSAGRRVQIFKKSGAGQDHPFAVDFPEGEYLKVAWCRVF